MILTAGALLGLVSVVLGAYAEHGFRASVSDEVFRSVMTAVRYNQIHAVVVVAIGLALLQPAIAQTNSLLSRTAWLFVAGTILFSFSIYLSVICSMPELTRVTPFGGVVLMAAWLSLAWVGIRSLGGGNG